MLLKRNVFIFFHIFFLSLYLLFMFSSCNTVPSVEAVSSHETVIQETGEQPGEIITGPEISTLYRPVCKIDISITIQGGEIPLPRLHPPESISLYTRTEAVFHDSSVKLDLLSPEPELKQEKQLDEIPSKDKKEEQSASIKEEQSTSTSGEPDIMKNLSGSKEKTEKSSVKEYKKETQKEKKEKSKQNHKMKEKTQPEDETPASHVSEIYTYIGENIEISFNNNGWIFAGYMNDDDAEGVKYLSKDTTYRESLFSFKSIKTGSYDLEFVLQDHISGSQQREIVRIHVVEDTEFVPDNSTDFITTSNLAEDFYGQGQYQHALEEYLKIYDEASPQLNEKIAGLYEQLGHYDSAIPYWEINLKRDDEYSIEAAENLLSCFLDAKIQDPGSTERIALYLDYLLDSGKVIPESEILKIVDLLEKRQAYDEAISVMDSYLSLCLNYNTRDALYFRLAGLYENNSGLRDLKLAKYYYEKIISEFPAGSYAQPARKRLEYLNRHFFHIH